MELAVQACGNAESSSLDGQDTSNPLYYHEAKEAFYFAAEAKAILAVRPELRSPDWQGLGEFVACGCVLEDRTIFKDVHVLPCASAWIFHGGEIERKQCYFPAGVGESISPGA